MSTVFIPSFAVLGFVNEGKTSVVATLSESPKARPDARAGATVRCQAFPVFVSDTEVLRFYDTPGFQNSKRALAWFREQEKIQPPGTDLLTLFRETHAGDPNFSSECELFWPVAEKDAGILYVVDGSARITENYLAEMEMLRMTGRPRMALINHKDQRKNHTVAWEMELGKFFNQTRRFNAHHATHHDRIALLRALQHMDGRKGWHDGFEEAIDAFERRWDKRRVEAVTTIVRMTGDCLGHVEKANYRHDAELPALKGRLDRKYRKNVSSIEHRGHERLLEIYAHSVKLEELPVLRVPLFHDANSQSNCNAASLPSVGGGGEVAMNRYRQLDSDERVQIATLRYQNFSLPHIAKILGRHRSTVWREVQRNRAPYDGGYRSARAHERAVARRRRSRRNQQFGHAEMGRVEGLLRQQWSPEQVAGHLRAQGEFSISHETIYRHVWRDLRRGGNLHVQMRGARKQRRKRYGRYDSRGRLAGKRHISERPAVVETRREPGHWEIDTVMGSTGACVVTLVERQSGYLLVGKMQARTTAELNRATFALMCRHPECFRTITADNGTEFHDYRSLEAATGVPFYFATPHHSWERGTNENTNGLLRQYLPKGTSLALLTQSRCDTIAETLNTRPRKRHAFQTPKTCFNVALQK